MANDPPFSGTGNDLASPITPADYENEINDNFSKVRDEILGLNNKIDNRTGPASGVDPFLESGQLEVNGHFMVHRRMHEVSRVLVIPANTNFARDPSYNNLPTGATLGLTGAGVYTYHPTICPGWFAPIELMPASGGAASDGYGEDPASGGFGMQINVPAGARIFDVNDEAVIFQPLSINTPLEKWRNRSVRYQIRYECDAAAGGEPEMYAAFDVGGVRTVVTAAMLSTPGSLGNEITQSFDFIPDSTATMLEIGIRIKDPLAHTFIFRQVVVSSNPTRGLANVFPGNLFAEQLLIETSFFRNLGGCQGADPISALAVVTLGTAYEKHIPMDNRRPVTDPAAWINQTRWSAGNGAVYAKPLLLENIAPVTAAVWAESTDAVACAIREDVARNGGAPYLDWDTAKHLSIQLEIGAVNAGMVGNNDPMVIYNGEWLTVFKPFLTT